MILTNRLFDRTSAKRDAKSIYIFCEGRKREFQYFEYFREIDSRINIDVYKLHPHEDNSPLGLLKIAENCIIPSDSNINPKYNFIEGDEVWIVLDIDKDRDDSREPQIQEVSMKCENKDGWFIAKSNPCFEVWLYYHTNQEKPNFEKSEICSEWKQLVNENISGGFDSRRHPIFIEKATLNASNNFELIENTPNLGSTEVYNIANSIIPLIKTKLDKVLNEIDK